MLNPLLKKLSDIFSTQNNGLPFFSRRGLKIKNVSELGPNGQAFIDKASERYDQSILNSPYTLEKVQAVYYFFAQLDCDLIGNVEGNEQEKIYANAWHDFWTRIKTQYASFGAKGLEIIKNEILTAYRSRVIRFCKFKAKGTRTTVVDELRAQEFLLRINGLFSSHPAQEAYHIIISQLHEKFEKDLSLDIQMLSRHLSTTNHKAYLHKFEETISRKAVEFLGKPAIKKIFNAISKDKEFVKQLPHLLEQSHKLKSFIKNLPEIFAD